MSRTLFGFQSTMAWSEIATSDSKTPGVQAWHSCTGAAGKAKRCKAAGSPVSIFHNKGMNIHKFYPKNASGRSWWLKICLVQNHLAVIKGSSFQVLLFVDLYICLQCSRSLQLPLFRSFWLFKYVEMAMFVSTTFKMAVQMPKNFEATGRVASDATGGASCNTGGAGLWFWEMFFFFFFLGTHSGSMMAISFIIPFD